MKYEKHFIPPGIVSAFLPGAILLLGFMLSSVAQAETGFGATISNTVTVSYEDSGGTGLPDVTSTVDVTVSLRETSPTLDAPIDQTVTTLGAAADYTYTITSGANGLDRYNLTSAVGAVTGNVTGATVIFRNAADTATITFIDLGATSVATGTTITAAGNTAVTVPSDGAADANYAGLIAGDVVLVNGALHTVVSVTDNNTGTETLTLAGNGVDNVVTAAMGIYEQAQFITRVTPTATGSGTVVVTTSARDQNSVAAATTDDTLTTVTVGALTVTKYVRNVTSPVVGGTSATYGGNTYYATGVTGDPGHVMEYLVRINNASGSTAFDVSAADAVPTYTTLQCFSDNYGGTSVAAGSCAAANFMGQISDGVTTADITFDVTDAESGGAGGVGTGGAAGDTAGSTFRFYVGDDAAAGSAGAATDTSGGDILNTETYDVVYRVTIN